MDAGGAAGADRRRAGGGRLRRLGGLFSSNDERIDAAAAASPTKAVVTAEPREQRGDLRTDGGEQTARRPPVYEREPTQLPRAGPTATGTTPAPAKHPPRIYAFGDSVMIGARDNLAARLGPGFSMNAEVGRQADEFVALVQGLRREGKRPNAVIIQMGNNGRSTATTWKRSRRRPRRSASSS